jgi:hypothetical protein
MILLQNDIETPSFFWSRLLPLGVTQANNTIKVENPDAEFPMPTVLDVPVFSEDGEGNIDILFYTIDRQLINYTKYGEGKTGSINGKTRHYKITRLKEPKQSDRKYLFPRTEGTSLKEGDATTFPFFPPALCDKFATGEKITTLYLTEGAFKAWKAGIVGLDCVGLTSITHYANKSKELHYDLQRLIKTCKVENIVILWDGDCLAVSKNDLADRKDLTRRPKGFFNAAKKIRELVSKIDAKQKPLVWFAHVKSDAFEGNPKGLDDMLICAEEKGKLDSVVRDAEGLCQHERPSYFFTKHYIHDTTAKLYEYFGLKDVTVFFGRHESTIGTTEFFYHNDQYKYNDDKNELQLLAPGWAKNLQWIGDDFFEENMIPGAIQDRRKLLPRKETTLKKLYGEDFLRYIKDKHCVSFCNVPNHFNYEQIVERPDGGKFYNRYFPFKHVPTEGGSCDTILNFTKHIFGDVEIKHNDNALRSYEMGLDYIQLLLTQPTQILPVLCFYSPENNTGKSTFTSFLIRLFGDNALQIGNRSSMSNMPTKFWRYVKKPCLSANGMPSASKR